MLNKLLCPQSYTFLGSQHLHNVRFFQFFCASTTYINLSVLKRNCLNDFFTAVIYFEVYLERALIAEAIKPNKELLVWKSECLKINFSSPTWFLSTDEAGVWICFCEASMFCVAGVRWKFSRNAWGCSQGEPNNHQGSLLCLLITEHTLCSCMKQLHTLPTITFASIMWCFAASLFKSNMTKSPLCNSN